MKVAIDGDVANSSRQLVSSVQKSQICETTAGFATERHYVRTGPNSIITSKQVCVPSSSFATCGPWTNIK